MVQENILSALTCVGKGMAALLGDDTEVVVHDLSERKIIFIANGHITGREVGYELNEALFNTITQYLDEDGILIGYTTRSIQGKALRSSHFLIRDASGLPCALICINQDTSKLSDACAILQKMISTKSMSPNSDSPAGSGDITQITRHLIAETIEEAKPSQLQKKSKKIEVLKKLEEKGVFSVRDAVPIVCKALSISQATLYNYLREIRSEAADFPAAENSLL